MIVDGGLSWNVRAYGGMPGLLFLLKLPLNDSPPTLELWYGYYNKPQITLVPVLLSAQDLVGVQIVHRKWYTIKTVCVGNEDILVYLDNKLMGKFEQGKRGSLSKFLANFQSFYLSIPLTFLQLAQI